MLTGHRGRGWVLRGLVLELKSLKNPNLGDSSNGITIVAAFREGHLSVADRLDGRLSRAEGRARVEGVNERVPRATQRGRVAAEGTRFTRGGSEDPAGQPHAHEVEALVLCVQDKGLAGMLL